MLSKQKEEERGEIKRGGVAEEMEYIWAQERLELVQLAAAQQLEALGLSVPRGEPCPEVKYGLLLCWVSLSLAMLSISAQEEGLWECVW